MDTEDEFFVQDETNILPTRPKVETPANEVKDDPSKTEDLHPASQFIAVKLSSLGKLDCPDIIHIRNFNMDDAIELSVAGDDKLLDQTIKTLNGMIKEGFDCSYLHEDELKELLLTVYANYWSQEITEYSYPWEEEELEGLDEERKTNIRNGKDKLYCTIPINKIKTKIINEKFKEPFTVTHDGLTITFRLPRVKDLLAARDYVDKKYLKEDKVFSDIDSELKSYKVEQWDYILREKYPDQYVDFISYKQAKQHDLIKATQAQVAIKYAKTKLDTLEKQLEYYSKIDFGFWSKYNKIEEEFGTFGIEDEVEVISPLTHKPVIRRFQFRFMDFIHSLELQDDANYSVEFGV